MSDARTTPGTSSPAGDDVLADDDGTYSPDADTGPAEPTLTPHPRPPRAGELTVGWRAVTAATWVGVIIALAAVWNTSVQLGLSTWWLGPRGDPHPRLVQLLPFVAPVVVLLAAINNVRRLPWLGLGASAVIAAIAVGDIDRVPGLAVVEFAIAGAAATVSLASLTGTYRAPGADRDSADISDTSTD